MDLGERFNEQLKENAGLYGAAGGMAALRGQQAQTKALEKIKNELHAAKSRAEREANVKRSLVTNEAEFLDILEETLSDEDKWWAGAAAYNFNENYCSSFFEGATDYLSSIDDIKYAKKLELRASKLDEILAPYCKLGQKLKSAGILQQFRLLILNAGGEEFAHRDELLLAILEGKNDFSIYENLNISEDSYADHFQHFCRLSKEAGIDVTELLSERSFIESIPHIVRSCPDEYETEVINYLKTGRFDSDQGKEPILISRKEPYLFTSAAFKSALDAPDSCFPDSFRKELSNFSKGKYSDYSDFADAIGKSKYFKRCFSRSDVMDKKPKASASSSSCFVATAVYGDPYHAQVVKLRSFRDRHLRQYLVGRLFIKAYYAVGPYLAIVPNNSPSARRLLRCLLDRF